MFKCDKMCLNVTHEEVLKGRNLLISYWEWSAMGLVSPQLFTFMFHELCYQFCTQVLKC